MTKWFLSLLSETLKNIYRRNLIVGWIQKRWSRVFCKKGVFKKFCNVYRKTHVLGVCSFMKNAETRTKVLSCEFGQTFKNNYFEEHLRTATSVEALLFFSNKFEKPIPFYWWVSTASRLELLRGGSLLFTTKFPEIPFTHCIDLRRMKGWVDLGATQWFWTRDPWIGNPAP